MNKYVNNREKDLININDIHEELFPLEESDTDFITKTGEIYKLYHDDMYFHKKSYINKTCGYVYVGISTREGNRNRRLHVLLAKTFINNPDPIHMTVVGHLDNDKTNNNLNNLYWTTTQENTQKAVNDELFLQNKGIDSVYSLPIAVYDHEDNLIAVYGSISECSRCISNITKSYIAHCIKQTYKSRIKKYIYKECSKDFYYQNKDKQNLFLEEIKNNKQMRKFTIKKKDNDYVLIIDNQKTASLITGISQAMISKILRNNTGTYKDWTFAVLENIEYKESSAYDNLLNTSSSYLLKNIHTDKILFYKTAKQIKDDYNLHGHDLKQYIQTGQTILNEWKLFEVIVKVA